MPSVKTKPSKIITTRLITNLFTDKLQESKHFYEDILDFRADFESNWYINLKSSDQQMEIGLIPKDTDLIPQNYIQHPNGVNLAFVVNDLDEVYERALNNNVRIILKPEDEFLGQRRMLIEDPNGLLLDISSRIF
ncbi:VOC family protein [Cecembia lonarensis]|uniref:Glyoxalase-like domain protein n=1 Tax=Cecembia lonarensis (strain CCUG 58316 / KCTC 22772 / LW9) TaxID=1225176 RepID=K1LTF7_CECL9|nr:VOC family protein [Cecembia lonarensis]EKB47439.1 Glyoxalase-like domain protein [Cecembia lonarensis LW9]